MLSPIQRQALDDALSRNDVLRSALEQFCQDEAERYRKQVQSAMAGVPRQVEHASDAAAKATAYDGFVKRLEAVLEQS